MNKTSYTNLAKVWQFVEDRAFSRQSPDLNEVRTAVEREGIPQGSAAQAELLSLLVHVLDASSIIAIGTASVVETLQLIDGLEGRGQLTAVDSSTEGIALIRKLFAGLSDRTQTTLRAVSAPVGTYLPRLNAGDYDLIVVAGGRVELRASLRACLTGAGRARRHRVHRRHGLGGSPRQWRRAQSRRPRRQGRGHAGTARRRAVG